jgi:hypothetical protein
MAKGFLVVHYSDEISNRQFILDFAKVVDFMRLPEIG